MRYQHTHLSLAALVICLLFTSWHQAHAKQTYDTLRQAHDFEKPAAELDGSDAVLLFGVFPALGVANAIVLTGNIVTMAKAQKRAQRTWGGIGLVVGVVTLLGAPLLADEGIGWAMLPVGIAGATLSLSIANLVLGNRKPTRAQKAMPTEMRPSGKMGGSAVPLLEATQ